MSSNREINKKSVAVTIALVVVIVGLGVWLQINIWLVLMSAIPGLLMYWDGSKRWGWSWLWVRGRYDE